MVLNGIFSFLKSFGGYHVPGEEMEICPRTLDDRSLPEKNISLCQSDDFLQKSPLGVFLSNSGANIFLVSFPLFFMIPELRVSVLPVLHYAYICATVNTCSVLSKVFQILAVSGEEHRDGLRKGIINRCIFALVTVYFNRIEHSWKKKICFITYHKSKIILFNVPLTDKKG